MEETDGTEGGGGLNRREDKVANITLGTETNAPLDYAPGLDHHHPILSTLGDPGGRLYTEREILFFGAALYLPMVEK